MTVHLPFENTYARLPDRFYARVAPTPVRAPRLIHLNTELAVDLGLDPEWLVGPQGTRGACGTAGPRGGGADCAGLRRTPVWTFCAATRRRPCRPAWRDCRPARRPARCPAQGFGAHAVFPTRRRPGSVGTSAARIRCERGHERAGHPNHTLSRRCHDRRNRGPGNRTSGCRSHPDRHEAISGSERFNSLRPGKTWRAFVFSQTMSSPGTTPMPRAPTVAISRSLNS